MTRRGQAGVLVCGAIALFFFGYVTHRNEWIPQRCRDALRVAFGSSRHDNARSERPFMGDAFPLQDRGGTLDAETRDQLGAMGYARAATPAPAQQGVTTYRAGAAYNRLNLYTSGHAPEAILMNMDGRVLHTWRCTLEKALPGYTPPAYVRDAARESWRRAFLYPDGSLLAIFEGMALIELDKDSKVNWTYTKGCHHDVCVVPGEGIYVLTSEMNNGVIDDGIALLDGEGNEIRRISLLESFRKSAYAPLLQWMPARGDVLHVNTVQFLDGSHAASNPAFARGNLLISVLTLNTVAVVDFEHKRIVWTLTGLTKAQHDPALLANGNILVFDNRGAGDRSRVLEIDPVTQAIAWQYPADSSTAFYSEWCGSAQRLGNGNTLITETGNARAFEVTPGHSIVWEFINPHQFDEHGVRMAAALFDVVRMDQGYAAGWLGKLPPQ